MAMEYETRQTAFPELSALTLLWQFLNHVADTYQINIDCILRLNFRVEPLKIIYKF